MNLRVANIGDAIAITELINESARGLCTRDYTVEQVEGALRGAFGLDTQLLHDKTYFVIEMGETIVACGGWSFRQTLFGSDAADIRDESRIDPVAGAAKVRAFFVDPGVARQGLGRQLLDACEHAAQQAGYTKLELMATLTGERLYAAHGFVSDDPIQHDLGNGLVIKFVPMTKHLSKHASK